MEPSLQDRDTTGGTEIEPSSTGAAPGTRSRLSIRAALEVAFLAALLIALIVRPLILEPFFIPSNSMAPLLELTNEP